MAGGGRFPGAGRSSYARKPWNAATGHQLDEDLKVVADSSAILQGAPTVVEPVALGDTSVASVGTSQKPAVEDHVHNLPTAAPGFPTQKLAADGVASSVMRSDAKIAQGIVTTKGDILTHDGTTAERLPVGADGYKLLSAGGELFWVPQESLRVVMVVADYAVQQDDTVLFVDATAGPITLTLPDPTDLFDVRITIKRIDSVIANAVTIDGDGFNIDGSGTQTLPAQWQSITIIGGETTAAWFIVAFNV